MRMISKFRYNAKHAVLCAVLMVPTTVVWAQGVPVEDDELGDVWGQAMFTVTNTDATTSIPYDFTKITLNADVKLNANFSNINLGIKTDGTGTDLAISDLRFVSDVSDPTNKPYVSIKDPYMEFVYKNQGSATDREIIGMRFGFGEITGNLGVKFQSLKGQITLADGTTTGAGVLSLNSSTTTSQFQCTTCGSGGTAGTVDMNKVGWIQANKSTDFFVSLLTESVSNFAGSGQSAPSGFSINWQSNLKYMGDLSGTVLPNPLPPLSIRQGG